MSSWHGRLAAELRRRRVPARSRRRILAELADHIACEPGCEQRLGDARALAQQFAGELATEGARRGALDAFGALALTAVVLVVSQLTIGAAGGYPGVGDGLTLALSVPAMLAMVFGSQVALVTGCLAAWRALRRRHATLMPSAEVALLARRTRIALLAGIATAAGMELYAVEASRTLALWWVLAVAVASGVALAGLCVALVTTRRCAAVVADIPGAAGDLYDDFPPLAFAARMPWRLGAAVALIVGAAMTLAEWHAEHSLAEGLQRGVVEGFALLLAFALFGRAIGARR